MPGQKHLNILHDANGPSNHLMHCNTLKQDNDSIVRGDGGSRVGEVRAGTTSPMPEHKGFKQMFIFNFAFETTRKGTHIAMIL